jgi:branched-chain amino acid transport system ATP-binding protein
MTVSRPALLELRDVEAAYGKVKSLHGVSLHVGAGEVVALIGANGAGKTTTLRVISGLLGILTGEIFFDGKPMSRRRPDEIVRAGIAHCPEERHVWPDMSVAENLRLGGHICGSRQETGRRIDSMLDRFPVLRERARQLAGTLSGGEQQMLAIARALMSEPRLLLLDEPNLGLSPKIVEQVLLAVTQLRDTGVTILLVEQNVHNALAVASRAYVLETGRVVAEDTAQGLLGNPDLLRAYLGG